MNDFTVEHHVESNIENSAAFFNSVAKIIEQARLHIGQTTDLTMCMTYFGIGRICKSQSLVRPANFATHCCKITMAQ
ncbi:MAG: hypothetical protein FWG90_05385 [Oscillospiraceae bacterium]|nr:hypothetical protein [Oscillospiraceae bacterium]